MSPGRIYADGNQIINIFLHPRTESLAFQLSRRQLKCFLDLGRDDTTQAGGSEMALPFA